MSRSITKLQLTNAFRYLDTLRNSGRTNMFNAPTFMQRELNYNRAEAVRCWKLWTDTFCGESLNARIKAAHSLLKDQQD